MCEENEEFSEIFDTIFHKIADRYCFVGMMQNFLILSPSENKTWDLYHYIDGGDVIPLMKKKNFQNLEEAKVGTIFFMLNSPFFGRRALDICYTREPDALASSKQKYRIKTLCPDKLKDRLTKEEAKQILSTYAIHSLLNRLGLESSE